MEGWAETQNYITNLSLGVVNRLEKQVGVQVSNRLKQQVGGQVSNRLEKQVGVQVSQSVNVKCSLFMSMHD